MKNANDSLQLASVLGENLCHLFINSIHSLVRHIIKGEIHNTEKYYTGTKTHYNLLQITLFKILFSEDRTCVLVPPSVVFV